MDKHIHIHRSRFLLVLLLRDFNRAKPESACSTDRDIEIGRRRIWPTLTISCENLVRVFSKSFPLTAEGMGSRLTKQSGGKADKILTTYRKSRPDASPADLYVAIGTARAFWLGSIEIAEKKYEQKAAPVYMYMFVHGSSLIVPGTNHRLGAAHATEIWYKFDNVDLEPPKGAPGPPLIGNDPQRAAAALNMSEMWTTFARTGHPGAKGQPTWTAYDTKTRPTMMIDAQCKVVNDPFGQELE